MQTQSSVRRRRLATIRAASAAAILAMLQFVTGSAADSQSLTVARDGMLPMAGFLLAEARMEPRDPLLEELARKDPQAADTLEAILLGIVDQGGNDPRPPGQTRWGSSPSDAGNTQSRLTGNPLILKAWKINPSSTEEALSVAGIRFPQASAQPKK